MRYKILAAALAVIITPNAFAQSAPVQNVGTKTQTQTQSQTESRTKSQHWSNTHELRESQSESSEFGSSVSYGLDQVAEGLACWQRIDPQAFDAWATAVQSVAGAEIPGARAYVEELLVGASTSELRGGTLFLALGRFSGTNAPATVTAVRASFNLKADAEALMAVGMSPVTDGCEAQGASLREELRHKLRDVLNQVGNDSTARNQR